MAQSELPPSSSGGAAVWMPACFIANFEDVRTLLSTLESGPFLPGILDGDDLNVLRRDRRIPQGAAQRVAFLINGQIYQVVRDGGGGSLADDSEVENKRSDRDPCQNFFYVNILILVKYLVAEVSGKVTSPDRLSASVVFGVA